MDRATALALGAVGVALVAASEPRLALPAALAAAGGGLVAPRRLIGRPASRFAFALGAFAIAGRVVLASPASSSTEETLSAEVRAGGAAHAAPGDVIHAEVASTIRLAGGRQDVLLALEGTLAYARLPRYPEFLPGDRLAIAGRVEPLPEAPGAEEARWVGYLRRIGVGATVEARSAVVEGSKEGPGSWLAGLRSRAGDALRIALPEPDAGLAAGILAGLRERVDPSLADDFTAAGLTHVVAISGWNIAIVGGVVGALARPLARRPRALSIGVVIAAYTVFAGASPSVVRAALMAGLALVAREGGRQAGARRALALAAVVMVAADPGTVSDAGFQLSACSTAGLIAWSGRAGATIDRLAPRLPSVIRESLAVSVSAQAATLPVVLLDFGRLSLVSPAANLVVAPLVPFVMAGAAAALPMGLLVDAGVPPILLGVPLALADLPLAMLVASARVAASVPYASVQLPPAMAVTAALVTALGLVVVVRLHRR